MKYFLRYVMFFQIFLLGIGGCAPKSVSTPGSLNPFVTINKQAAEISNLMTWTMTLAMLTIGLGVTLGIYLKTTLGPAIAAGGGAVFVISMFTKSTAWFTPYLAAATLVAGVVFLGVRVWKTGSFKAALFGSAGG